MNEENDFNLWEKAEAKARRAWELYDVGEFSQALAELEAALEISSANSFWRFNKGLLLDSLNRFDEAINEYKTVLELEPGSLEAMNSLAVDYIRTGQYELALEMFEKIQELEPQFEPCYCNRIITYTEMGQHDLAEQMFYLAQQIKPDCSLCYYNIGISLFVQGEYKKAIRCWLKSAELEPTPPQINYRIALAYWLDDNSAFSREYFLSEIRRNPGDIEVILDFGLFLLELGEIESAEKNFAWILELLPDFGPALFYLGEIAFNKREFPKALQLFSNAKKARMLGPSYRIAQYNLMIENKKEARNELLDELRHSPEDPDVLVSMGSMFLAIGALGYAANCLLRAVNIDCSNADAYYYLGLVSAVKKQFEDAAAFFADALDIRPLDSRALEASAIVYLAIGRLDKARERIKKARSISDNSCLKSFSRRIWLAHFFQGRGKRIKRLLLERKRQKTLETMVSLYKQLAWYPNSKSCLKSKGRRLKPSGIPQLLVRKAAWREAS